jgi:hypothetical protein
MTDQPAPEGTGTPATEMPATEMPATEMPATEMPATEMPSADPAPTPAPPMAAAAMPPPMPPPAPIAAPVAPAAPPPAVAWQAPPPAAPVKGQRTALAMVAGILLILLAIGGGLIGVLALVVGGTIISSLGSNIGNIPGYNGDPAALVTGVLAFFAIIILAYSVAYLLAGIGVLRNSGWGRVLGIVIGILSGLIWLGSITGAGSNGTAGGGAFSIILFGVHAYIVVVLLFFWRYKRAA